VPPAASARPAPPPVTLPVDDFEPFAAPPSAPVAPVPLAAPEARPSAPPPPAAAPPPAAVPAAPPPAAAPAAPPPVAAPAARPAAAALGEPTAPPAAAPAPPSASSGDATGGGARAGASAAAAAAGGGGGGASAAPAPAPAAAPATPAAAAAAAARAERERAIVSRRLALKRLLQDGAVLTKFGRSGYPHARHVWLSDDCEVLRWRKPGAAAAPARAGDDSCIRVADIVDVVEGPASAVFQRNLRYVKAAGCCLSVVATARTLDVEAPSEKAREEWATALLALQKYRGGW